MHKMLKMLKIGCLKQNYWISGMPQVFQYNFCSNSGESLVTVTSFTHIHSGLQQILLLQNFNSWKMLKMLKIGCFKQNYCISVCLKVFQCNFLLNSGKSQVTVTNFTHIHSGFCKFYFFQNS